MINIFLILVSCLSASASSYITQTSKQKFEVSKKLVVKEFPDPVKVLDTFSAAPSFRDGPLSGIEVDEFSKECPLPKFGIKNGDIIQMVNGQNIRTPNDILEIGKKLSSLNIGSAVRVSIRRGEKTLVNSYLIKQ